MKVTLADTTEKDLSFVIESERNPANKSFIAQWELARHQWAVKETDFRHCLITLDNEAVGYLIMAGLDNPNKSLELMRLVINEKGKGLGHAAIEEVKKYAFQELAYHRLWLDVREKNERARSLYRKCGFTNEGLIRETVIVDGQYESVYIMSILESEYNKEKQLK